MAKQEGRVVSAAIYTCRQSGVLSRNNTCLEKPQIIYSADQIMQAFEDFAGSPERCKLVLTLDNDREISIMPVVRKDVAIFVDGRDTVADIEKKIADLKNHPERPWEVSVELWPR